MCIRDRCYTMQHFSVILEAVVSSAAILAWNKTSRAQKEQFYWPMTLNVATQVVAKVLHCATWEKFLATLRNALRKVELTSTFRNDCGNKKIATNVCSRVCYTRQYFVQLVPQQNCETSCKRNCLVSQRLTSYFSCNLSRNDFGRCRECYTVKLFRVTCPAAMSPKHCETSCTKHFTVCGFFFTRC